MTAGAGLVLLWLLGGLHPQFIWELLELAAVVFAVRGIWRWLHRPRRRAGDFARGAVLGALIAAFLGDWFWR